MHVCSFSLKRAGYHCPGWRKERDNNPLRRVRSECWFCTGATRRTPPPGEDVPEGGPGNPPGIHGVNWSPKWALWEGVEGVVVGYVGCVGEGVAGVR